MSNLGSGVMLSILGGNRDSVEAFSAAVGKRIASIEMVNDELVIGLSDGSRVALYDDGQSCCETRYMRTDDDLSAFVGAELVSAEVRGGPEEEDECGGVHETAFLVVTTSLGAFTCVTHNEHNGYYGGFALRARAVPVEEAKQ